MKRHTWFIGLLTIAVLLFNGCRVGGGNVQVMQGTPAAPGERVAPTPLPALPASKVILMDGELVAASPSLELSFSGSASGELTALNVRVGQRVRAGDLIATLDDGELQKAVDDAQLALDRAVEDKEKAERDAEDEYQRQIKDAETKYEDELRQARQKLEAARDALEQAKMQPPTTSLAEAKLNLARAINAEAQAEDEYKQALDRPWEPQRIRDALYKEWQARIEDRKMAQLKLEDAQTALNAHYLNLDIKAKDVQNAEADLARVEGDTVEREESLTYGRAIEDARRKLDDAQGALADARLDAPWDGLVVSIDANIGSEVNSSTPIVTLINLAQLYFVTDNLSERHVAQLRPGQQANITLRAYPDSVIAGQVDSVIPQAETSVSTESRFAAYIRLDTGTRQGTEDELALLPGMTGRVEVVTEEE